VAGGNAERLGLAAGPVATELATTLLLADTQQLATTANAQERP